jgi:hypothetical protein
VLMTPGLKGMVILITGAARGIGAAIAAGGAGAGPPKPSSLWTATPSIRTPALSKP